MSKTTIGVIIGVVVLVGAYFLLTSNKGAENGPMNGKSQGGTEKKMAFSEFVKQGGSYKCSVVQALSDMENSGTVYFSGNMVSGEYNTVAEGRAITTYFIFRDGYSYTWSSFAPNTGFKVKEETDTETRGTYSWDASQIGDYNCESWTPDQARFAVPTDVTFQELEPK